MGKRAMRKNQQPQERKEGQNVLRRSKYASESGLQSEYDPYLVRQARMGPEMLSPQGIAILQRTIGNRTVQRLLQADGEERRARADSLSEVTTSQLQRACSCGGGCPKCQGKPEEEGALSVSRKFESDAIQASGYDTLIQRTLSSPRFAGDTTLEAVQAGSRTLKKGDDNDSVRKIQHGIHDAGILFLGHGMDGKFGDETEQRVSRFQRRNRIAGDPSGEVGTGTVEKLDQLFPATALPASSSDPYTFAGMLELLCQWNSAMINDLKNLRVEMVADLSWADEEFDGTNWVPKPMPGAGETSGLSIIISTKGTNEDVARSLYHEYQHARQPVAYRTKDWGDEESRVYTLETYWAIDRGLTADPSLTTTDPTTGQVEIDPGGVSSTVESYPGLDAANPGEVIGKVGANRVRVRMPNGRVTVRNAIAGDSVPGPRQITAPRHRVRDREWQC
jgi:peptidoglycan hydrolase-like protein with peptidoglycan-binding domain